MTLRILTCSNTSFIVEATKYLLRMSEMQRRFLDDASKTYIESLQATDPASDTFLSYDKLLPLAKLGNVLLNKADFAVAKQHVSSHI